MVDQSKWVATFGIIFSFLTILYVWFRLAIFTDKKAKENEAKLQLDPSCTNLVEWFQQDSEKNILYGFGNIINKHSTMKQIKNVAKKKRNLYQTQINKYFGKGNISRIDRFTAILNEEGIEIGHIEAIFIQSKKFAILIKDFGIIGLIFGAYIAPKLRNNGYGKLLILECIKHFQNNGILDIYVSVSKENIYSFKICQQIGFSKIKEIHSGGMIDILMKYG